MGYGIWDMGYGIWDMGHGNWDTRIDLVIQDIDVRYGISIGEMKEYILSSLKSIWDMGYRYIG